MQILFKSMGNACPLQVQANFTIRKELFHNKRQSSFSQRSYRKSCFSKWSYRKSCFTQRSYSSLIYESLEGYWQRLQSGIDCVKWKQLYPGAIYAYTSFIDPYPGITDFEILKLAIIQLVEQYAVNIDSEYIKFTIGYTMQLHQAYDIDYTLGKAIPLCDTEGNTLPKKMIYDMIEQLVMLNGDKYQDSAIKGVFIRIYYEYKYSLKVLEFPKIPDDMLEMIINVMNSEIVRGNLPDVKSLMYKEGRIPTQISAIKSNIKECRAFIVADIETLVVNNVHLPYAAGFLVVNPGDDLTSLPSYSIKTFFSESHIPFYPQFEDRSQRMLFEFISYLEDTVLKNNKNNIRVRTVYFHNLARFDGIFLLRYYADHGNKYKIKTLLRNHSLYELKVYLGDKLLFRFRDSNTLLTNPLEKLALTLCPELGSKGSIDHDSLSVSNLRLHSADVIEYLRQDILILGGVMLKAQYINWSKYGVDVEDVMTLSALSIKIFRKKYLDEKAFYIGIPTRNQDTFIRRGYYGGHVDVYKPYGENLYYYDVNSLYPFIMKSYPMPCGIPVWKNNLESVELDSLFGFIEAYVVCPPNISSPFLSYKDKHGTLVFPTGKFIGVFYSEELKFARDIGYFVIPLRGYLFEKKASPFDSFISDLYKSRLEAKKAGDEAMTFVYKILMNSLYGRFGINPESLVTEICNQKRYEDFLKRESFQSADKLTDEHYIVNYMSHGSFTDNDDWKAPKMSAVQLSAAITACARIYMYPYVSRPDCYYTDTDSIVLGSPLPDDIISSSELGKFKLEYKVNKGIFLAPKSYWLETEDGQEIMKFKGPAKDLITSEWFKNQLADLSKTEKIPTYSNFRIDWKTLQIVKKEMIFKLGLPQSTKRENVYDSNNLWVGTRPLDVIDLGFQDANTILKYELMKINEESVSQSTTEGDKTIPLQPTNGKAKKGKAKKGKAKKDNENSLPNRPKPDE